MWWCRLYAWKMDLYPRAWWYRMLIRSCTVAVRMPLWWWEIVWCIPSEKEDPSGKDSHSPLCRLLWPRHYKGSTVIKQQRQEKLFEELDLSGLESWPPKLVASALSLLAEYHNVFSFEPSELGCTHSTEHVIKVTNDTLFKEWFKQIPLPLVEEVCKHLQEMLDSGAICPSQRAWCNAVVLVKKKDGGLCFCIDFQCLNAYTKKDSYPLSRIQGALENLVGAGHFSWLDLKSRFWQIKMDKSSKQYTVLTVSNLGFF